MLLTESLPLDFDAKDKLGRSVKMIASLVCKELIPDVGEYQTLQVFPTCIYHILSVAYHCEYTFSLFALFI